MWKGYFESIIIQFWAQMNADYQDFKYKERILKNKYHGQTELYQ